MAKFVMECPNCGKYVEARTGFFARKKIDCVCGYTINVKTDSLSSRECTNCGNIVVFAQRKGDKAICPVCKEPINTIVEQTKTEEISCAQCGVRLIVNKDAATYTCPVCDCVNNVAERIALEKIRRDGDASIIKYEGTSDTLIWKHPVEDFNVGSQLIVHESQEAIFFRNGQALDRFGAGRYTLETQQPIFEKLKSLSADDDRTLHSEVYFINMATTMGIKWGTDSKVRMFDPASGLHLELGACGEFNIRVLNSRKLLLKLVGTGGGLKQDQILGMGIGKGYFRAMIMTQVKSCLAQEIKSCGINILEIDEHLAELSVSLREHLNSYLNDYGLEMPEFFVSRIMTPDDDPNFRRLKEQYAEQYLLVRQEQIRKGEAEAAAQRKAVEEETKARMKIIGAQGEAEALKIQKAAEAEAYRMQAEAEAAEMRMKGYTYQQETARQVGLGTTKAMATGGMASGIGEIAGLGMTLGAMGSVIDMTKNAMSGLTRVSAETEQNADYGHGTAGVINSVSGSWDCSCGQKGINSNFCPNCGAKKPDMNVAGTWDCTCGMKAISSKFCPNCGRKRPEKPEEWDCPSCGMKKITFNFCPNCGTKKPEIPSTWDCSCGVKGITFNFCPNCGKKRGE